MLANPFSLQGRLTSTTYSVTLGLSIALIFVGLVGALWALGIEPFVPGSKRFTTESAPLFAGAAAAACLVSSALIIRRWRDIGSLSDYRLTCMKIYFYVGMPLCALNQVLTPLIEGTYYRNPILNWFLVAILIAAAFYRSGAEEETASAARARGKPPRLDRVLGPRQEHAAFPTAGPPPDRRHSGFGQRTRKS